MVSLCVDILLRKRPKKTLTVLDILFKALLRFLLLQRLWQREHTGLKFETECSVKMYPNVSETQVYISELAIS